MEKQGRCPEGSENPDEALTEALEPIAARISAALGIERESTETPVQFLDRFAGQCEEITLRLGEQYGYLESERDAANKERDEAKAEVEQFRAELDALKAGGSEVKTNPAEPLLILHSLGVDIVGELIAAGFDTPEKLSGASDEELDAVQGIGPVTGAEKFANCWHEAKRKAKSWL